MVIRATDTELDITGERAVGAALAALKPGAGVTFAADPAADTSPREQPRLLRRGEARHRPDDPDRTVTWATEQLCYTSFEPSYHPLPERPMPEAPEPRVEDTRLLSPVQIAEMVAEARAVKAAKVENERTDEHRPLGVVLNQPPRE